MHQLHQAPADVVLQRARWEFYMETKQFYSSDTTRRGLSSNNICVYKDHASGTECALGRHIPANKYHSGLEGQVVQMMNQVWHALPANIRALGVDFLRCVQLLHDGKWFWNKEGLSAHGREICNIIEDGIRYKNPTFTDVKKRIKQIALHHQQSFGMFNNPYVITLEQDSASVKAKIQAYLDTHIASHHEINDAVDQMFANDDLQSYTEVQQAVLFEQPLTLKPIGCHMHAPDHINYLLGKYSYSGMHITGPPLILDYSGGIV